MSKKHDMEREGKRIIFIFICIYVLVSSFLLFLALQRSLIYYPDTSAPELPKQAKAVDVVTEDGLVLRGWYFRGRRDKPVILFFHGNGGNISQRLFKIALFREDGYSILLAEYRGYGGNQGHPSESGLYRDALAYLRWLQDHDKKKPIILYGESLGAAVAVKLAAFVPVKALILEAPFARLSDALDIHFNALGFIETVMQDKYRAIDHISALHIPKLFLLAGQDEVVGVKSGRKLYDAAAQPKTIALFEESGHNDLYMYNAGARVLDFLETLEKPRPRN